MKLFKKIDICVQLLLLATGIVLAQVSKDYLLYGYFLVGGWQLLSVTIHFIYRHQYYPIKQRTYYLWVLQAFLITGVLSFFTLIFGIILLVFSPLLALWYLSICNTELDIQKKRDFIHLK